jgi:hypothetical protein
VHCSPAVPRGTVAPVAGSTILTSTCGGVWVDTGVVSVMPHAIVTSSMCMRERTCDMTSTGHGAPAMTPVRRVDRSKRSNPACSSMAMNIVGTPYSEVHRSASTASSTASGSNDSLGRTTQAPWVTDARLPITIPNVW